MKIKYTLKSLFAAILFAATNLNVSAQGFTENFDDVTTLSGSGWFQQNNSTTIGTNPNWIQGVPTPTGPFNAFNGATNAYICSNFNSTTGTNTISNWLVAPNRTFRNGDIIRFYTCKASPDTYPDRLEVRLSTNGASTNVGTGAVAVGDFTTLLLSVNPTLVTGVYPTTWTQYTITISGLPAPTSGRFAFRYFVTNGGPTGANSDFIGIDNVVYTPYVCPVLSITPTSLTGATAGVAYSQTLSQTGALGTPSYAVTAGALPAGVSLTLGGVLTGTPTVVGTFNFTVTVSDASGCSGSQAYSLTVGCPTFVFAPGSLPSGTAGVAYNQTVSTTGGVGTTTYAVTAGSLPTGLSLASTGVISGTPSATGTFNFTVTATDANSCTGSAAYSITINCPTGGATFTVSPASVCFNAGIVTISGGAPAGGTYTGTGVSGTDFNSAAGSQTITYTVVDGFGCTQIATDVIGSTVPPTVTASSDAAANTVCEGADVTLTGGGADTYVWDNSVMDGVAFTPAATMAYTVTGTETATGCSATATITVTVNTLPTVTLAPFLTPVCDNGGLITLTDGTPTGGVFSGTSVTGNSFDPSIGAGTYAITYTVTDGNGCENSDVQDIEVEVCTGVLNIAAADKLNVYPNPSNGLFTVVYNQAVSGNLTVKISDVQGKVIAIESITNFAGTYNSSFDLSSFDKGIYLLEVIGNQNHEYKKIILQ
jgi:hypothetical protein